MKRVLLIIAPGSEDLETTAVHNLLRRAGIHVTLASTERGAIVMARGMTVMADCSLDDIGNDAFDMVILPGGLPGAENLRDSPLVKRILQTQVSREGWVGAICAAPAFVLAHYGMLDGVQATCYPGFEDRLTDYQSSKDVVIDGKIITSRGPGTAIAFGLSIIEQLAGTGARRDVEKQLLL